MLFNSYIYILLFLPTTCFVYFLLARSHEFAARVWLVAASLFFYGWWEITYVPLILASSLFNYAMGASMLKGRAPPIYLTVGVAANLLLLAYFKYADFILHNILVLTGRTHEPLNIVLPLAISFFTFQQIAYLVDCYRQQAKEYDFFNYLVFVCFFPQLIAGPIVHHREMMPQFEDPRNLRVNDSNIMLGLLLFSIGFFKKVVLADTYAIWATSGFDEAQILAFSEAWATSLSYTLQLYFDFSGYTDMALGSALLLNIRLPFNFNSPYKATSIRDFWRRWHMTLSRFLRDYLYIPLGGNRRHELRVLANLFLTFLLGGLWHGAAWTFVIWGALHGAGMMVYRTWGRLGLTMPPMFGSLITFLFVNAAWVVFRANSLSDAIKVYEGMIAIGSIESINILWTAALIAGLMAVVALPNSNILRDRRNLPLVPTAIFAGIIMSISMFILEIRKTSEFLYFQF